MKQFFLLLLFSGLSEPVTHTLRYLLTSARPPGVPEFMFSAELDDVPLVSCARPPKARFEWMEELLEEHKYQRDLYTYFCFKEKTLFPGQLSEIMQLTNQTEGSHVLQSSIGCHLDTDTDETFSFLRYGYNGEDFLELDLKTGTWLARTPEAVPVKRAWDVAKLSIYVTQRILARLCEWLPVYLDRGKSMLLRTELPEVFLLQKSPSSPVTCRATGFYPNRALLFWRKDGGKLHEGVENGETLPNHDGTFQLSSRLQLSVPPEDWGKYECVFQLSGVAEDLVTKLENPAEVKPPINAVAVILLPLAVPVALAAAAAAAGVVIYKKKHAPPPDVPEVSEPLRPNTGMEETL